MPYPSRDLEPQILEPTEEQLKFKNLPAKETGAYQANQDRWVAAEEYAKSLGAREDAVKPLAPDVTGLPANPAVRAQAAKQRSDFQKRKLDEANAKVATWKNRVAIPIQNYPSIAKAMLQSPELTEADVKRMVNFASAWTAADAINAQETAQGQVNIFLSLPEAQRYVVNDILNSQKEYSRDSAERRKRDQRLAAEEEATYGPARQLAAGFGEGIADLATGFMRGVDNIYEGTAHTLAAFQYGKVQSARTGDDQGRVGGYSILDPFFYWEDTADGTYDNAVIQEARKEYGDIPVDLILEIKQASLEGDPTPITSISQKYVNDPARAEYIALLTQRVIDDPERLKNQERILSLADKLDTASTSDFGAMLTTNNPVTGDPADIGSDWRGSMLQQGLSKSINVTAAVVADPTIVLGKAYRVYRGARFGLEKLASTAGAESIEKALSMPTVNSYITDMTADIARYNAAREAGQSTAKMGKKLADNYKTFFPQDLILDLAKAKVHTPEEFIDYVIETNRMAKIARAEVAGMESVGLLPKGEAGRRIADIEGATAFGRMLGQQGARRSKPLLPQNRMLAVSNLRRSIPEFVAGRGDKVTRDKELQKLFGDANDPNKSFGMMLNESAERLGTQARMGQQGLSPSRNIAAAWDKTTRLFSTTPGDTKIYTKDARDTDMFYKYARMHLPKHQAQLLADEWRNGTQAERVLMWVGIVRTSTYARGFEDIKDMMLRLPNDKKMTVGEYVKTLSVGTREDVRFSPSSIDIIEDGKVIKFDDYLTPAVEGQNPALFDVSSVGENIVRTSPSDFNGIEHPLHLWQTSDYLSVPNLNELQRITKRNALVNLVRGKTDGQSVATEIINYWSLLNLVGPRYAVRNATEDWVLYALTGGYFLDAVKGFGIAKGVREARGEGLGMVARARRKLADRAAASDPSNLWNSLIRPNLLPEELNAAKVAMAEGNLMVARDLTMKAILRLETGRLLTKEEQRFVSKFASSSSAYSTLDRISESAAHLGNGTVPGADILGAVNRGMISDETLIIYPRGSYKDVALSGETLDPKNSGRYTYWHQGIRNTILADGSIGKIAMENLDNPEEAIRLVAQELSRDTKYGYKQRLAAFFDMRTAASDDEFARRYIQDVANLFSRKDGSFNEQFWSRFVMKNDDGTRTVKFATNVDGRWTAPISIKEMMQMDIKDMPQYVLGRETQLEAIKLEMSISDKIWQMMGNTVNRISREPIFFANYLQQRKQLLNYERALVADMGADLAEDTVHRHALDRATQVMLSYTDNPANQTILAWRLRNWARYYRATEDFYRRVYRMAKFEPIGFYKAALTLNALEDQGFIHTDEYGDKYFMYPGDGLMNNVVGRVTSFLTGGTDSYIGSTPLVFGGKVKMLAPSFDPNAAMPMLGGPIAAVTVKTILNIVPQFQNFEKYILGEYSVGKNVFETTMPAPVLRFLAALDNDQRNSMYSSAYMSAIKVLDAAGKLPELTDNDMTQDEVQDAVSTVATNILTSRFIASFIYQASPQVMENDVTTFARKYGIPSMSSDYRNRVQKFRDAGEVDPYGMALQDGISVFGINYTTWNVSPRERGDELKALPETRFLNTIFDFEKNNKAVIKKYPAAAYFLAPTEGEFEVSAIRQAEEAGLIQSSDTGDFTRRLRYADGMYILREANRAYREDLAAATNEGEINLANAAIKDAKIKIFAKYPGLAAYSTERIGANGERSWEGEAINRNNPESVRRMVDDYYAGKFGDIPKSVQYIAEAMNTYDYFKTQMNEITGSSGPEKVAKNGYKTQLLNSLKSISADDPNAAIFIKQVLYVILNADSEGNLR